jgi:TonB family protein
MLAPVHHKVLPVFLLLSSVIHLIFLTHANFNLSPHAAAPDPLGQTLLSVRLTSTEYSGDQSIFPPITPQHVIAGRNSEELAPTVSRPPEMSGDSPAPGTLAKDVANRQEAVPEHAADTDETHNQLLGELQTRLSRYLVYPPVARRRGWEGTVLLGMRVESDGHLHQLRIDRSSGYTVLDHSALNSLNRMGRLAEATTWLKGREMDMQLPVIYRLIDN